MSRVGALHNVENNQAEEVLQRTVTALVYDNQRGQYLNTTLNGFTNQINLVDGKIKFATTQQAQQGINDDSIMTPLKTKQAIQQGGTFTGNLKIETNAPILEFSETDQNSKYFFVLDGGTFSLRKDRLDNSVNPLTVASNGAVFINDINIEDLFQSVSNGKAQVAAAITGKGLPTAANSTFNTLATNINAITTGLREASGTVFSSSTPLPMVRMDGVSTSSPRVVVSGLDFMPRYITLLDENSSTQYTYETYYNADRQTSFAGAILTSYDRGIGTAGGSLNINPNSTNTYINNTGFALPVSNVSTNIRWKAIG